MEVLEQDSKNDYEIVKTMRMLNKYRSDCLSVRLELKDDQTLDRLLKTRLYHEDCHYRLVEWRNNTIFFFKCQFIGFKSTECKRDAACAICASKNKNGAFKMRMKFKKKYQM